MPLEEIQQRDPFNSPFAFFRRVLSFCACLDVSPICKLGAPNSLTFMIFLLLLASIPDNISN
jgi:hypothetical protein